MLTDIIREITPLTKSDCFTFFSRVKKKFDFPIHYHEEYELNLILNAKGAKRIVGDSIELIDDLELVFIGPNQYHTWFTNQCKSEEITEVTIWFNKDLFDTNLLKKNQLSFIRNMLDRSQRGISFSRRTIEKLKSRILSLSEKNGFHSVLELFSILHDLSISRNMQILSDAAFNNEKSPYNSRRIEKVFEYMNANFNREISLAEVSKIANMPEASFSRFIKKSTGITFVDSLNEIRLGHASRLLIDTSQTISEIAYKCGFNNISHFNRIFKKKKICTPKEFREYYSGNQIFV